MRFDGSNKIILPAWAVIWHGVQRMLVSGGRLQTSDFSAVLEAALRYALETVVERTAKQESEASFLV
jgi:hypothetical protein